MEDEDLAVIYDLNSEPYRVNGNYIKVSKGGIFWSKFSQALVTLEMFFTQSCNIVKNFKDVIGPNLVIQSNSTGMSICVHYNHDIVNTAKVCVVRGNSKKILIFAALELKTHT